MKKTELNFFEYNNLAVYEYYPFYEVFRTIEELKKITTDNKQISRGINYSIIIQLATFIEGMSSQILWSSIEPKLYEIERVSELDKSFFFRVLENLEREVVNSYFKDFDKNWNLIHGVNLKSEIKKKDSNLWESIEMIFILRNAISHGNKLTVEYHPTENGNEFEIKVIEKYKNIYDFLTKNKLIKANSLGMVDLVNIEIIDFFTNEALKFINALTLTIPNKLEKQYAIDLVQFIKKHSL